MAYLLIINLLIGIFDVYLQDKVLASGETLREIYLYKTRAESESFENRTKEWSKT